MDVREKATNRKRMIDASALLDEFLNQYTERERDGNLVFAACEIKQDFADMISNVPTVDAVPVIRCRECKHWKPSGSKAGNSFSDIEYIGGCEFTKYCCLESDFCSCGERKEGAD